MPGPSHAITSTIVEVEKWYAFSVYCLTYVLLTPTFPDYINLICTFPIPEDLDAQTRQIVGQVSQTARLIRHATYANVHSPRWQRKTVKAARSRGNSG